MLQPHTLRPAAFRRRALPATLMLLLGGTVSAAPMSAWRELAADPRAAHADSMTAQERWNLAREYGVESDLPQPNATTRYYSNCNDSGPGSLRDAVASAVSGDSVEPQNLNCSTISLTSGEIASGATDLNISGPGRAALTVRNGAASGRVFRHTGTGRFLLLGMTVADGHILDTTPDALTTYGGCIYSKGAVDLGNPLDPADTTQGVIVRDCQATSDDYSVLGGGVYAKKGVLLAASSVSGCRAITLSSNRSAVGGGVYAGGAGLGMKYSEIRDNRAESGAYSLGGGVWAKSSAGMSISHSTIAGNFAQSGMGGAYLVGNGTLEIEHSTISGNSSADGISGAYLGSPGNIEVVSSTVAVNTSNADQPALLLGSGGAITLQSSIVSGNHGAGQPMDLGLSAHDGIGGANNLVGVVTAHSEPPPPTGLIVSNTPGIASLASNGGPTRTHALLANSAAIDKGTDDDSIHYDQRGAGYPRKIGAHTDIGAVERNPDVIFFNGFE